MHIEGAWKTVGSWRSSEVDDEVSDFLIDSELVDGSLLLAITVRMDNSGRMNHDATEPHCNNL
jgi:hypothetical protein